MSPALDPLQRFHPIQTHPYTLEQDGNEDDEIDKVYIIGFGDKATIEYRNKEVELMKIKLSKRDTKGTKIRT